MKTAVFGMFVPSIIIAMTMGLGPAAARDFTQKETGKTLTGKVTGVDAAAGTVTMRLEGILIEITGESDDVIKDLVAPNLRERKIREALEPSAGA